MRLRPPPELENEALLQFENICAAMGDRLNESHRTTIAIHSVAWAAWQTAQRHIDAHGVVVTLNGARVANPFFEVYTEAANVILDTLDALGLTPMARAAEGRESDGIAPGELDEDEED